jgi:acetyl-CoA carboxylase carboxyltransferase component
VLGHHPPRLRRGGRRPHQRRAPQVPLRLALQRLGELAHRGRHREAAYKSDLEASEDPEALHQEIIERLNHVRSPFRTAEAFLVEEVIDPRDTRPLLCEFANLAAPLRQPGRRSYGLRP